MSMFGNFSTIRIIEDKNCRSTKEFRDEWVALPRTWWERFVDGPVWKPLPPLKPPRMMSMGIPTAYELVGQRTIIAHPEIAAQVRAALSKRQLPRAEVVKS